MLTMALLVKTQKQCSLYCYQSDQIEKQQISKKDYSRLSQIRVEVTVTCADKAHSRWKGQWKAFIRPLTKGHVMDADTRSVGSEKRAWWREGPMCVTPHVSCAIGSVDRVAALRVCFWFRVRLFSDKAGHLPLSEQKPSKAWIIYSVCKHNDPKLTEIIFSVRYS